MNEKRVLVIDDEDFIRELVKEFLEMESVLCDGAEEPQRAMDLIRQNTYDLILLDRNLGQNKAEDIIQQIHKINAAIPIVILTGDAYSKDKRPLEDNAVGIIYKPFTISKFMTEITKFLEI